ncbi:hypothetical protein [Qipengyuania zhejiangensis]|uniref:hypothetical protein n=1 Tax=Qipengyuania zhejiangensis TaxID=3077782 RepID=UPI002D784053|nr:hypothetical protein [Qipengyuania sp. Z2]
MHDFEDYELLNEALNDVLFDGRFAMKPVYVDLEEDVAAEVSRQLGIEPKDLDDFIAVAVEETLLANPVNPYSWHTKRLRNWIRRGRQTPPPFTGLLAALSLAAEKMRADTQFSATNYYERLFEVLGVEDVHLQGLLRNKARYTRPFWRELNQWLTEHDFELGRPTARQVNSWKYVSYALSQALVRDADRQRLHHLFRDFGLSPLDDIEESEMMLHLHDWMTGTGPSAWIRRLWSNVDLRERLAAAAIAELESWDEAEAGNGQNRKRLSWAASISTFPRRRISLHLATASLERDDDIELTPLDTGSKAARLAFRACDEKPWLAPAGSGDFSVLEPTNGIDIGALMLATIELESKEGGSYFHLARPIIPLAKLDTGIFFREVQRTSLLKRHAVLCHEHWTAQVSNHLDKCARPGFRISTCERLPGLPPDWVLFEDVEIVRVLDTAHNNLAVLVPLSEGVAIKPEGGLRLAPQIWHRDAPPNVVATSDQGEFTLEIRMPGDETEDECLLSRGSSKGSCEFAPEEISTAGASELSIVAIAGRQESGEKNLAFRDADIPRPMRGEQLSYCLDPSFPASILNAVERSKNAECLLEVRGMIVRGEVPAMVELSMADTEFQGDVEDEASESTEEYLVSEIEGVSETCVIRGYHYWICEPGHMDDTRWEAKRMDCKDCKLTAVLRNRGRNQRGGRQARRGSGSSTVSAPPVEERTSEIDLDLVLDGLCYLGTGTWHAFQSLSSAHSQEPWFAWSLAQDLRDLGHIDIARSSFGRVTGWSVPPPAIVVKADGEAYLAGFRNRRLIDEVGDALEAEDCEYNVESTGGGVTRHSWKGVSIEVARSALEGIKDPFGRTVAVEEVPAATLLAGSPGLADLVGSLSPVHFESKDGLERFDARSGRWGLVSQSVEPGAYRTNFAGRRYFIRDSIGETKSSSPGLAKLFAARLEGVRLHDYDPAIGRLVSGLGCDLPGLFSRAIVSCSGRLPSEGRGRLFYEQVEEPIASRLLSKLYGA